jgi:hypothetical protein
MGEIFLEQLGNNLRALIRPLCDYLSKRSVVNDLHNPKLVYSRDEYPQTPSAPKLVRGQYSLGRYSNPAGIEVCRTSSASIIRQVIKKRYIHHGDVLSEYEMYRCINASVVIHCLIVRFDVAVRCDLLLARAQEADLTAGIAWDLTESMFLSSISITSK